MAAPPLEQRVPDALWFTRVLASWNVNSPRRLQFPAKFKEYLRTARKIDIYRENGRQWHGKVVYDHHQHYSIHHSLWRRILEDTNLQVGQVVGFELENWNSNRTIWRMRISRNGQEEVIGEALQYILDHIVQDDEDVDGPPGFLPHQLNQVHGHHVVHDQGHEVIVLSDSE